MTEAKVGLGSGAEEQAKVVAGSGAQFEGQAKLNSGSASNPNTDQALPDFAVLRQQLRDSLSDLQQQAHLGPGMLLVIGASTSEVMGRKIGTATSLEVGELIAGEAIDFAKSTGCDVAFQCCEHLNRALVVTKPVVRDRGWQEVVARPVPGAGGAVAASAFHLLPEACLVESIRAQADAGIDIGDTFIGMHIKHVVVPVRGSHREMGQAHLTMARTRPPLIGGSRAVYDEDVYRQRMGL